MLEQILSLKEKHWAAKTVQYYAAHIPGGITYLEIGTQWGRSFYRFVVGCDDQFSRAVLVDPWDKSHIAHKKKRQQLQVLEWIWIMDMKDRVEIMEMTSDVAIASLERQAGEFDLALIDGDHDPAQFRKDLEGVWTLMKDDGFVVCDDLEWRQGDGILHEYEDFLKHTPGVQEDFRCMGTGLQGVGVLKKVPG